jgi:hypothetical protein
MAASDELHRLLDAASDAVPDGIARDDPIATRWGIGAATFSEGNIAIYSLFAPKGCGSRQVLDVSGLSVTGNDGTAEIQLSDFHCYFPPPFADPGRWVYNRPVNVTATARGSQPTFITTDTRLGTATDPSAFDIRITVFSWRPNGRPRPSAAFYWRCRALIENVGEFDTPSGL